jgi:hypothetical protein
MQERETMHRGGRRLRDVLAATLLVFVGVTPVSALSNGPERSAWALAGSLSDLMTQQAMPGVRSAGTRRAFVHSTLSNPYMLDGLVGSDCVAGIETASSSAWLDWRHLAHTLYCEDRLGAALEGRLPLGGLRFAALPAIEKRQVRGFEAVMTHSLSLAASYESARTVCAGFVRAVYESDSPPPRRTAAFFTLRAGPVMFAINHGVGGGKDTRFALGARFDRRCSVAVGYRWKTGELASGLVVDLSQVSLDFSWSQNPALGSTLSAGVGRWWEW